MLDKIFSYCGTNSHQTLLSQTILGGKEKTFRYKNSWIQDFEVKTCKENVVGTLNSFQHIHGIRDIDV